MAVTWDKCTVNITNNTGSSLTYSTSNTIQGGIDTPSSIGGAANSTGSFDAYSNPNNASDGCAGTVTYSLPDGTLFIINYKTSYYYGADDNSAYSAGYQGANASRYSQSVSSTSYASNGGAGKRVTVTVTAGLA